MLNPAQMEAVKQIHGPVLILAGAGTGKTRVAIALAELLIRAGWAKRVLFLCDRKELRKQAKNAFTDFLDSEPIRVVNSRVNGAATERIFISTYPAMLKVYHKAVMDLKRAEDALSQQMEFWSVT